MKQQSRSYHPSLIWSSTFFPRLNAACRECKVYCNWKLGIYCLARERGIAPHRNCTWVISLTQLRLWKESTDDLSWSHGSKRWLYFEKSHGLSHLIQAPSSHRKSQVMPIISIQSDTKYSLWVIAIGLRGYTRSISPLCQPDDSSVDLEAWPSACGILLTTFAFRGRLISALLKSQKRKFG